MVSLSWFDKLTMTILTFLPGTSFKKFLQIVYTSPQKKDSKEVFSGIFFYSLVFIY